MPRIVLENSDWQREERFISSVLTVLHKCEKVIIKDPYFNNIVEVGTRQSKAIPLKVVLTSYAPFWDKLEKIAGCAVRGKFNYSKETIVINYNLCNLSSRPSSLKLLGVVPHEWTHFIQCTYGYRINRDNERVMETQASFLTNCFITAFFPEEYEWREAHVKELSPLLVANFRNVLHSTPELQVASNWVYDLIESRKSELRSTKESQPINLIKYKTTPKFQ